MKRSAGKWLCLLLVLAMVAGLVPITGSREVEAAPSGITYTHDMDIIKGLLEQDGDVHIVLDGEAFVNIRDYRADDPTTVWWTADYWCELGSGEKVLDLNGQTFEVDLDGARKTGMYEQKVALFHVKSGTVFTINDSSGSNSGKLKLEAYMQSINHEFCGLEYYTERTVLTRNGIQVDGGTLIFNGGKLCGGRTKEQWATSAWDLDLVWDYYQRKSEFDVGLNEKYTGYLKQQINCDGIILNSGNVIINGGVIQGRGFRVMQVGTKWGNYKDTSRTRAAAVYMTGGNLTINGGTFQGLGGADVLDLYGDVNNVTIRSGEFKTEKVEKCVFPRAMDADYPMRNKNLYFDTGYGYIGIPASVLDPVSQIVISHGQEIKASDWAPATLTNTSKDMEVNARKDVPFELYNETYGETVGNEIIWDGETDVVLTAPAVPFWPWEQIPYNKSQNGEVRHIISGRAEASKDTGVTSGVSITGSGGTIQVSAGGGSAETYADKRLKGDEFIDRENGKMTIHLRDLLPEGMGIGKSFLVTVLWGDSVYNGGSAPSAYIAYRTQFIVKLRENDMNIIAHPSGVSVSNKGDPVTLLAQAENAKGAYWEQVYPSSTTEGLAGTFDPVTGMASLTVPVNSSARYVCCFTNSMGMKKTNEASVSVIQSPTLAEGDVKEVKWFTSQETIYLNTGISNNGEGQRWYYRATNADTWTQLSKIPGKMDPETYSGTLFLRHPETSDAGYYRMEADYNTGTGLKTVKSGIYHATVIDAPPDDIYDVYIHGFDDLYVGDQAPGTDKLWVDDSRVAITDVAWEGLSNSGKIATPNASVTVTLATVTEDAVFATDSDDHFTVHFGDSWTVVKVPPILSKTSIEIGYAFTPNKPLPVPQEKIAIASGTSYSIHTGEEVDILLEYEVVESERPKESGVSHVTGLAEDHTASGRLPEGLALVQDGNGTWHIRGTVTQEASAEIIHSPVYFSLEDDNGTSTGTLTAVFAFAVTPKISTLSLPADISEIFHEHTYDEWTDAGDGETHMHKCTGCGNEEAQPHLWDDGVVTTPATGTASGTMTYTCGVCGAVKTEEIDPHVIIWVDEVPATCVSEGSKATYACEDCGAAFEDAAGTVLTEDTSTLILPLADHDWGEWTITREATDTQEGEKTRVCKTEASHTDTEAIPKVTVEYTVESAGVEGSGTAAWIAGSGKNYVITVKRSYEDAKCFDHFAEVKMDGTALVNGTDYTAAAGSTVVTLKADYLETLSKGNHAVTVAFDDGSAAATMTIAEKGSTPATTPKDNSTPQKGNTPGTGDSNRSPAFWIVLIIAACMVIAAVITASVYKAKRRR